MSAIDLPFSGAIPLVLFLAKATLLLAVAYGATMWLRHSTAGARHLIWLAALVGVLALPLLSRIPTLRLGLLPELLSPAAPAALTPPPGGTTIIIGAPGPDAVVIGGVSGGVSTTPSSDAILTPGSAAMPATPPAPAAIDIMPQATPFDGITVGSRVLEVLAALWAVVTLALVGWLVAGMFYVRRIVRKARELTSPDWTMPLCEVADRLDLEVPPRLVISDRIEMAFACRALQPTVVLPASADSWSDDRRRAVLFHELAHVKRHDLVGHMLGRLACALYWFHPLVWSAAKNLRAESERACDDLVLSCGARASEYAQHLLEMVTAVRDHGAPVMALPMARKKEFEGRMLAILDPHIRRASPGRAQAAAVVATIGALSLTVAAVAPASARQAPETPAPAVAAAAEAASAPPAPESQPALAQKATPAATPTDTPDVIEPSDLRKLVSTATHTALATVTHTSVSTIANDAANVATKEVVKELLGGKSISRAGKQGPDSARVQALIRILATDTDASVRRTAAWGLSDMQSASARAALMKALRTDADWSVREMAAWALEDYDGDADASAALVDALKDKNAKVRSTAVWALGSTDARSAAGAIEGAMSDPDGEVRESAIWAFGQIDEHKAPSVLVNALTDSDAHIRRIAAWTLGQVADRETAKAIAKAFGTEQDKDVRLAEIRALAEMGESSPDVLDAALRSADPDVRRRAVGMLAGNSGSWSWPMPRPRPRPNP